MVADLRLVGLRVPDDIHRSCTTPRLQKAASDERRMLVRIGNTPGGTNSRITLSGPHLLDSVEPIESAYSPAPRYGNDARLRHVIAPDLQATRSTGVSSRAGTWQWMTRRAQPAKELLLRLVLAGAARGSRDAGSTTSSRPDGDEEAVAAATRIGLEACTGEYQGTGQGPGELDVVVCPPSPLADMEWSSSLRRVCAFRSRSFDPARVRVGCRLGVKQTLGGRDYPQGPRAVRVPDLPPNIEGLFD